MTLKDLSAIRLESEKALKKDSRSNAFRIAMEQIAHDLEVYLDHAQVLQLEERHLEPIKSEMAVLSTMLTEALSVETGPLSTLIQLFYAAIALRDALSKAVALYETTKAAAGLDKLTIHHKQKLMMQWCELTSALFTARDTAGLEAAALQVDDLKAKICSHIKSCLKSGPKEKDALQLLGKFKVFLMDEKMAEILDSSYQHLAMSVNCYILGLVLRFDEQRHALKHPSTNNSFVSCYEKMMDAQEALADYVAEVSELVGSVWLHRYLPAGTFAKLKAVESHCEEGEILQLWVRHWKMVRFDLTQPVLKALGSDPAFVVNINDTIFEYVVEYELFATLYANLPEDCHRRAIELNAVKPVAVSIKSIVECFRQVAAARAEALSVLEGKRACILKRLQEFTVMSWRDLVDDEVESVLEGTWSLQTLLKRITEDIEELERVFGSETEIPALRVKLNEALTRIDYLEESEHCSLLHWIDQSLARRLVSLLLKDIALSAFRPSLNLSALSSLESTKKILSEGYRNFVHDKAKDLAGFAVGSHAYLQETLLSGAETQMLGNLDILLAAAENSDTLKTLAEKILILNGILENSPSDELLNSLGTIMSLSSWFDCYADIAIIPSTIIIDSLHLSLAEALESLRHHNETFIKDLVQFNELESTKERLHQSGEWLKQYAQLIVDDSDTLRQYIGCMRFGEKEDVFAWSSMLATLSTQLAGQAQSDVPALYAHLKTLTVLSDFKKSSLKDTFDERLQALNVQLCTGADCDEAECKLLLQELGVLGDYARINDVSDARIAKLTARLEELRLERERKELEAALGKAWRQFEHVDVLEIDCDYAAETINAHRKRALELESAEILDKISIYAGTLDLIVELKKHAFEARHYRQLIGAAQNCSRSVQVADLLSKQTDLIPSSIQAAVAERLKEARSNSILDEIGTEAKSLAIAYSARALPPSIRFSNLEAIVKALESNMALLLHIRAQNATQFLADRISLLQATFDRYIEKLKLIETIQSCWRQTEDLVEKVLSEETDTEFEKCKAVFVGIFLERAGSDICLETLEAMRLEEPAQVFTRRLQQVTEAIRDLRELYPVLSFVSDAELLDLAKSFTLPETLNRYLSKLILGIEAVSVDNDGRIVAVQGCNNNVLSLIESVQIDQYAHVGELIIQLRLAIQKSLASRAETDSRFAVKIGPFELPYEFNYVPVTDYVETSRSRRFFLTAAAAMSQGLGVCLFGPAGTGKTETVKALGAKVGVPVYVYCCDETFEYRSFERIMAGIESIGGWLCLDEFNRLDQGTMSSVSDLIHAKMTGKSAGIRIFMTINPLYIGRQHLPANVVALFRQFSFESSDEFAIVNARLDSEELSWQFLRTFHCLESYLSGHQTYDFSLRTIQLLLRMTSTETASELVRNLTDLMLVRSSTVHLPLIEKAISEGFAVKDFALDTDKARLAKGLLDHSAGWLVTGAESMLGFVEALAKQDAVEVVACDIAALGKVFVFGEYDAAAREWKDGLFTESLRRAQTATIWFVFYGTVESAELEQLNSFLDDSRTLTLASGERIFKPPGFKVFFLAESLSGLSRALISRCIVVNLDGYKHHSVDDCIRANDLAPPDEAIGNTHPERLQLHPLSQPQEVVSFFDSKTVVVIDNLEMANSATKALLATLQSKAGYWTYSHPPRWIQTPRLALMPSSGQSRLTAGIEHESLRELLPSEIAMLKASRYILCEAYQRLLLQIIFLLEHKTSFILAGPRGSGKKRLLSEATKIVPVQIRTCSAEALLNDLVVGQDVLSVVRQARTDECIVIVDEGGYNPALEAIAHICPRICVPELSVIDLTQLAQDCGLSAVLDAELFAAFTVSCSHFQMATACALLESITALHTARSSQLAQKQEATLQRLTAFTGTVEQIQRETERLDEQNRRLSVLSAQSEVELGHASKLKNESLVKKTEISQLIQDLNARQEALIAEKSKVAEQLASIEPEICISRAAVEQISKKQLIEIRTMNNPPETVKLTLEAVCIALKLPFDSWRAIQSTLKRDDFMANVLAFDASAMMTDRSCDILKNGYFSNRNFSFDTVNRASKACGPLVRWLRAQVSHFEAVRSIEPLRERVRKLEAELSTTEQDIKLKDAELVELDKSILASEQELKLLEAASESLQSESRRLEASITKAQQLVELLEPESHLWADQLKELELKVSCITGDSFYLAVVLVLFGDLNDGGRRELGLKVRRLLESHAIPSSATNGYFDADSVQRLLMCGLPHEQAFLESMFIVLNASKPSLVISSAVDVPKILSQYLDAPVAALEALRIWELASAPLILSMDSGAFSLPEILSATRQRQVFVCCKELSDSVAASVASSFKIVRFDSTALSLKLAAHDLILNMFSSGALDYRQTKTDLIEVDLNINRIKDELSAAIVVGCEALLQDQSMLSQLQMLKSNLTSSIEERNARTLSVEAHEQMLKKWSIVTERFAAIGSWLIDGGLSKAFACSLRRLLPALQRTLQENTVDVALRALSSELYCDLSCSMPAADRLCFRQYLAARYQTELGEALSTVATGDPADLISESKPLLLVGATASALCQIRAKCNVHSVALGSIVKLQEAEHELQAASENVLLIENVYLCRDFEQRLLPRLMAAQRRVVLTTALEAFPSKALQEQCHVLVLDELAPYKDIMGLVRNLYPQNWMSQVCGIHAELHERSRLQAWAAPLGSYDFTIQDLHFCYSMLEDRVNGDDWSTVRLALECTYGVKMSNAYDRAIFDALLRTSNQETILMIDEEPEYQESSISAAHAAAIDLSQAIPNPASAIRSLELSHGDEIVLTTETCTEAAIVARVTGIQVSKVLGHFASDLVFCKASQLSSKVSTWSVFLHGSRHVSSPLLCRFIIPSSSNDNCDLILSHSRNPVAFITASACYPE